MGVLRGEAEEVLAQQELDEVLEFGGCGDELAQGSEDAVSLNALRDGPAQQGAGVLKGAIDLLEAPQLGFELGNRVALVVERAACVVDEPHALVDVALCE